MGTVIGTSSDIPILEVICEIIICYALFQNALILIYHIHRTRVNMKENEEDSKYRVIYISIISIFLMVLSNISNILLTFSLIPSILINCRWQINIQLLAYIYSKICLYVLFLERLFTVFIDSDLQFTKIKMYTARIYLLLLLSFYSIMIYIYSNGTYNNKLNGCSFNHPFWLNIIAAICDSSTITTILILFSRRLWIISHRITDDIQTKVVRMHNINNKNISNSDSRSSITITSTATNSNSNINSNTNNSQNTNNINNRLSLRPIDSHSVTFHHIMHSISNQINLAKWTADEMLLSVLRKITILNIIAVISTLCSMLLCCFIFPTLWISIDSMINCWSILLMFKYYDKIYQFCCYKISNNLSDECLSCCSCHCFCSVVSSSVNNNNNGDDNKINNNSNNDRTKNNKNSNNKNSKNDNETLR